MIFTGTLRIGAGLLSAGLVIALGSAPASAAAVASGGALDPAFGAGGTVLTDITGAGNSESATDVVVAPDGKIIAVGSTLIRDSGEEEDQSDYDFAVARYNADGSPDATFGAGGVVRTSFGGPQSSDMAKAVALQTDGKIVVAG